MSAPSTERIAFTRRLADVGEQVFTAAPDGSCVRQITFSADHGESWSPAWSPDGRRLCVVSRRDGTSSLYVLAADGHSEQRPLTDLPTDLDQPAWSRDGTRIAFCQGDGNGPDRIMVLHLASGEVTQLTSPSLLDGSPAWSPDGQLLAFRRCFGAPGGIHVVLADGGEARFVVPGDNPRFAPGGAHLAFSHAEAIWVTPLTADAHVCGVATRLTGVIGARDRHPCWSPDGSEILFAREAYLGEDREPHLMVVRADGGEARHVCPGSEPDWTVVS